MFSRISDVRSQQSTAASNRKRKPRQIQIETMEVRQVMAANITAALGYDGVLKVEGTPNNDRIALHNEAGKVWIDYLTMNVSVAIYGTLAMAQVPSTMVKNIEVLGLAGDDVITMRENLTGGSVAIGMTVYGGKGNDNIYGGSGRDILMGGDKLDSEQTGLDAATLDAQNKFYSAGSEFLNTLGKNEKWFYGGTNVWHYIKPNGEVWKWTGTGDGTMLGKLDTAYYTNLPSLLDADSGPTAGSQARVLNLFSPGNNLYQNSGGKNEKWVQSVTNGSWYFITPDGTFYKQTVSGYATGDVVATLDVSYWNDVNRLLNANKLFGDDDTIYGYGDKDQLLGGAGSDTLSGGTGADYIFGGAGNDGLFGDEDGDNIYGDIGADSISGGAGDDYLYGGDGADTIYGGADNDTIWGGSENNLFMYVNDADRLYGELGNDKIHGGGASDSIYGGDNDDMIWGDDGVDYLYGGNGNDSLYGGAATDYLYGEAGNDGLFGGYNDPVDQLTGGTGADRFIAGQDNVKDLEAQDAQVFFVYGDKSWTDNEIILADQGLGWLQQKTNNTQLLKMPNGQALYFYRNAYLGADIGGNNNDLGTIRISDLGVTMGLDTNIVHEVGHNWDQPAQSANFRNLSGWKYYNLSAAPVPAGYMQATNLGVKQGEWVNGQYYCWIYLSNTQFVREYGRTSPDEDFATCLEGYYAVTKGTGTPAANWQAKWNYVNTWLAGKHTA